MTDFIYPLSSVILNFLCLLLCIRFLASKRGSIWLFPLFLTLALLAGSTVCLLATASKIGFENITLVASYVSVFLFILSIIWLINIAALGSYTGKRRTSSEDKKTFNEAEYVKRKTAPEAYFKKYDKRVTKKHKITKVKNKNSQVIKSNASMYDNGPVSTKNVLKSSFRN